jgi:hypothetical protein
VTRGDLSSGLTKQRENTIAGPPKQPFWSENLLFALYDPECDIGLWLHLGTVPSDWQLWEDRVLMLLPGDEGVGSMCGYHRTPERLRPSASCLAFECLEPYRRWRITFDGFFQRTSNNQMTEGRARHGRQQRLRLDLQAECATAVWDAHQAELATGNAAPGSQGWAKEHYEQLVRASGRVTVDETEYHFQGTGWRNHSCGPRGGGSGAPWGGHVIQTCLFPSGRGIGLSRYWMPNGAVSLESAYVVDERGALHHAQIVEAARLTRLELTGEKLPIGLRWDGGELRLTGETRRSLWASMAYDLAVGVDVSRPGLIYALNFGPVSWDGETGWLYSERSDMLKRATGALPLSASR